MSSQRVVNPKLVEEVRVQKAEAPQLMPTNRIRVVGVVHPVYDFKTDEKPVSPEGFDELMLLDKKAERIKKEATNPHALMLFVSADASREDFKRLCDLGSEGRARVFDLDPVSTSTRDKMERLADAGFEKNYDELWLLGKGLDTFSVERTLFHPNTIDSDELYRQMHEPGLGERLGTGKSPDVEAIWFGTYFSQCLKAERNDFNHIMNLPTNRSIMIQNLSIDLLQSSGTNRAMEYQRLLTEGGETHARAGWKEYARDIVRQRRGYKEPATYELFDPAQIRTFLLNPEYLEDFFERYRLDRVGKSLKLQAKSSIDEGGPQIIHFPASLWASRKIVSFLRGKDSDSYELRTRDDWDHVKKPWQAGKTGAQTLRLRLASYLSGRSIESEDSLLRFSQEYRQKINEARLT